MKIKLLTYTMFALSFTPLSVNDVATYEPSNDFFVNQKVGKAIDEVCNNDYIVEGFGCISGELENLKIDVSSYIPGISKSELLFVVDNLTTMEAYLYVYRDSYDKIYDSISLSNSLEIESTSDKTFKEYFKTYTLTPVSITKDGYFVKYLIDGLTIKQNSDGFRRYLVNKVYDYEHKEDLEYYLWSSTNEFRFSGNEFQKVSNDTIVIENKKVYWDLIPVNENSRDSEATQLAYMFFNTSYDELFTEKRASLKEASVSYKKFGYIGQVELKDTGNKNILTALKEKEFRGYKDIAQLKSGYSPFGHISNNYPVIETYNVNSKPAASVEEYYNSKGSEIVVENKIITPKKESVPNKGWFLSTHKYTWETMGLVKDIETKLAKPDLKWYIQFDRNDNVALHRGTYYMNGESVSSLDLGNLCEFIPGPPGSNQSAYNYYTGDNHYIYDYLDTQINSLKFEFEDGSIHNYITVDTLTDSDGFWDLSESPKSLWEQIQQYLWLIITILVIVIILVIVGMFAPGLISIIFNALLVVLKVILKIGLLLIKLVLWVPYLLFISWIQYLVCKKNGKEFKLWNPFKFKK